LYEWYIPFYTFISNQSDINEVYDKHYCTEVY